MSKEDLVGEADVNEEDQGISIPEDQESHEEWIPNEQEEQALSGGWRPKDEWDGDPEDWVTAREFNFRGDLMKRITALGRKVGDLEQTNNRQAQMIAASDGVTQKLIDNAIAQTRRDLRAQRRAAMEDGDISTVEQVEERMDELNQAARQAAQPVPVAGNQVQQAPVSPIHVAWEQFVRTTPWAQDPKIHQQLLAHAENMVQTQPTGLSVGDFMESVLEKGKALRQPRTRAPGQPDDGKGRTRKKAESRGGKQKYSAADLNSQQRAIGQGYVEEGIMKSLDEYAADLAAAGGLDSQRR
jgi:hypothetical protein